MELTNRVLDVLNYPIVQRCIELGLIIDRCSIKQLQDVYTLLMRSIFGLNGGMGWGLRAITKNLNPHEFEILYNFFIPLGPMFRMCYRLLSDALKFEIPIAYVPEKLRQVLESGRYPIFYSDLVNVDPFERKIHSLALNAFDYYIMHFVIHGTHPMHKEYPAALNIQNDKLKSVYFFLTADYLCMFLPCDPDAGILPQCGSFKTSQRIPVQQVQSPMRSPKYLSMSAISHFSPTNNPSTQSPEVQRDHAWRSESVLYMFIDTWLRFECDEFGDLPSNEFIRVARILVKQIHSFGNSADFDNSYISGLRKIAQPMLNARMYPFLRSIMSRWPLDSSFSVVLELWLSFIQPWRYTFNRNVSIGSDIPIAPKYEQFIAENLTCYTQIYVQLLPRFLRSDLTLFRNVLMMFRLLKVFGQSNLAEIIRSHEMAVSSCYVTNLSSLSYSISPKRDRTRHDFSNYSRGETTYYPDETYVPIFSGEIIDQVGDLVRKLQISRAISLEQIESIEASLREYYKGFIGWLRWWFRDAESNTVDGINMADRKKIPDILQLCTNTLGRIFSIEISESPLLMPDVNDMTGDSTGVYNMNGSTDLDLSNPNKISPMLMKKRALAISYAGDPELIPIQSNECTFLVRFLYQLSCKINFMYSREMNELWHRNNLWGRMARHLLTPPMVVRTFDKTGGYSRLKEQKLPARLSLRFLAKYRTLVIVILSFLIGHLVFRAPSYGFFILQLVTFLYLLVISCIYNVPM